MSSEIRLKQIADAAYRAIHAKNVFRRATKFELRKSIPSIVFLVYLHSDANTTAYKIIDRHGVDLNDVERQEVMTMVVSRLGADGLTYRPTVGNCVDITPLEIDSRALLPASLIPHETDVTLVQCKRASDVISDHAFFFRRIGLTPDQLRVVQAELPAGAPNNDLFLLSCFSADVLRECGLTRVQIAAWEKLVAEKPAA